MPGADSDSDGSARHVRPRSSGAEVDRAREAGLRRADELIARKEPVRPAWGQAGAYKPRSMTEATSNEGSSGEEFAALVSINEKLDRIIMLLTQAIRWSKRFRRTSKPC